MSWIKIDESTPDKPEIHAMAELLGRSPDAVLGMLIRVWIWADQQTYNGQCVLTVNQNQAMISSIFTRLTGERRFADAMIAVGWLQNCDETCDEIATKLATKAPLPGGTIFPNFDRHNGQTAKQRALASNRQADFRRSKTVTLGALPDQRRSFDEEDRDEGDELSRNSLEWIGKPDPDQVKPIANGILRILYPRRSPQSDRTRQAVWMLACLRVSGAVSEARVAEITETAVAPKVRDRSRYVAACLRNLCKERGVTYDAVAAALPPTPKKGTTDGN